MAKEIKPELYVPNKDFDNSLDAEGLADVFCDRLNGCDMRKVGSGYRGKINIGSGEIYLRAYGIRDDGVRAMMYHDNLVRRKHLSQIRRFFNDIGLMKKIE